MATELATAYIALVPSAKGIKGNIESELGGAGTTAASKTEAAFGKSARNVGSVLKGALIGAAAGGAAAFGAIKVGNELLSIGARVESFRQKSKTVFEGQSDDVRKWADKNNESFGVTDDELTGLAANFGDLLKPMGFTSAEAAKMSTDVVGLSGALSSWSGGTLSASDASDTLAKAMLGERDGLKALGISISEADVQAKLAEKGHLGGLRRGTITVGIPTSSQMGWCADTVTQKPSRTSTSKVVGLWPRPKSAYPCRIGSKTSRRSTPASTIQIGMVGWTRRSTSRAPSKPSKSETSQRSSNARSSTISGGHLNVCDPRLCR